MNDIHHDLNRRNFLKFAGGSALAATSLKLSAADDKEAKKMLRMMTKALS